MKRVYKFEGIDCACCAGKLEEEIKALDGVKTASVNFITQKLSFEGDNIKEIEERVLALIAKEEPDCELSRA